MERSPEEEKRRQAIQEGRLLRLAPRLDLAAAKLERLFLTVLKREEVRLGGGTVLAARYRHRTSHDLDYWYNDEAVKRLVAQDNEYVWEMMMGRKGQLDPGRMSVRRGCKGKIGGVEFGLSPSNEGIWFDIGQDIRGKRCKAQSSVMILAGKMLKRWTILNQKVPIRDLVDVTIAARIEPEAVDSVLTACGEHERAQIIRNLQATPIDQHKRDRKKITACKYRIRLEGLAQQMIRMVEEGNAEAAPEATPEDAQVHQRQHHTEIGPGSER